MELRFNDNHSLNDYSLLERELDLFRLLISSTAEGVCLVGQSDKKIVYANSKCEKIFGYLPDELIGQLINIFNIHPSEESLIDEVLKNADQVKVYGKYGCEVKNRTKNNTIIWCLVHTVQFNHPIFGLVYCLLFEDITMEKRVQQILGVNNLKSFNKMPE